MAPHELEEWITLDSFRAEEHAEDERARALEAQVNAALAQPPGGGR